jgi:hypothetical protein
MTRRYIKNAKLNRQHGFTYKMYVNSENEEFWNAVEFAKLLGMVPSNYFCKAVIEKYHNDLLKLPLLYEEKHKLEQDQIKLLEHMTKYPNKKDINYYNKIKGVKDRFLEDIKAYQPVTELIVEQEQEQEQKFTSKKRTIPPLPPRELTDEEKETSEKIASGEWIVVTDEELDNMKDDNDEEFEVE